MHRIYVKFWNKSRSFEACFTSFFIKQRYIMQFDELRSGSIQESRTELAPKSSSHLGCSIYISISNSRTRQRCRAMPLCQTPKCQRSDSKGIHSHYCKECWSVFAIKVPSHSRDINAYEQLICFRFFLLSGIHQQHNAKYFRT